MAARSSSRLRKITAFWILTLINVISVARSQQSVPAECVRVCRPQQLKRLTIKVSKLFSSCYQQCQRVRKAAYQQAPVRTGTFQKRFRKALPSDPNCSNSSPNQTQDWSPSKVNVTFGRYENTIHWFAKISWTPMNDANESWTSVQIRFFAGTSGVGDINCLTYPKNQSVATVNVSSYGYQYPKDIFLRIIGLPFSSKLGEDMGTYGPVDDVPQTVTSVAVTPSSDMGTSHYSTSRTVTVSLVGLLVGLLLVGCLIYIIRRKKKSHKLPPEFKYHAFIIYSREDESWVTGELLPFLEEESCLKCCIHYRDFIPGISYEDNMADSVYNSYKIISVFSKDFVLSNYCNHELDLAKHRLLKERDDSLVVIRIDKTSCKKLPRGLEKRSVIDYANPLERPFWKSRLLKFLDSPKDLDEECFEEDKDNNNIFPNDSIEENKPKRNSYERTISTVTEVSVISETEATSI